NGQIKLKVAPEVSDLDPRHSLQIGGFVLPSLTTRKAATVVELKDGQSFAIAGLFQQQYANAAKQIPWIGDVPVLGALFKSNEWQRNESELVIIVTPHLTAPVDRLQDLHTPVDSPTEPDLLDLLLTSKSFDQPFAAPVSVKGESASPRKLAEAKR